MGIGNLNGELVPQKIGLWEGLWYIFLMGGGRGSVRVALGSATCGLGVLSTMRKQAE